MHRPPPLPPGHHYLVQKRGNSLRELPAPPNPACRLWRAAGGRTLLAAGSGRGRCLRGVPAVRAEVASRPQSGEVLRGRPGRVAAAGGRPAAPARGSSSGPLPTALPRPSAVPGPAMSQPVTAATYVRSLRYGLLRQLADLLDPQEGWKRLAAAITDPAGESRYSQAHIRSAVAVP